jgi:hypothetical protein
VSSSEELSRKGTPLVSPEAAEAPASTDDLSSAVKATFCLYLFYFCILLKQFSFYFRAMNIPVVAISGPEEELVFLLMSAP